MDSKRHVSGFESLNIVDTFAYNTDSSIVSSLFVGRVLKSHDKTKLVLWIGASDNFQAVNNVIEVFLVVL